MKLVDVIKHLPHKVVFTVIPSLEGWSTMAKEAPCPHEERLTLLDTNPVFQCLGEMQMICCYAIQKVKLGLVAIPVSLGYNFCFS